MSLSELPINGLSWPIVNLFSASCFLAKFDKDNILIILAICDLDFDTALAFEAMQNSAMQDHLGLSFYKKNGFLSINN